MKMISERRAAAYAAIAALLSGAIFGLAIPAAIQAGQRNAMDMAWEPAEASWYEERTQRTVYALDPTPSYLDLLGSELHSLSAEPDPGSVWDVSAQGLHPFRGTFRGQGRSTPTTSLPGRTPTRWISPARMDRGQSSCVRPTMPPLGNSLTAPLHCRMRAPRCA